MTNLKKILFLSVLVSVLGFSGPAHSEEASGDSSKTAWQQWKQQLEIFRTQAFKSAVEVMTSATEIQNKIADSEELTYAQKVSLRKQMYNLEKQRTHEFPPPQLIGFKKTMTDPKDPSKGYTVEPEYQ